MCDLSLQILLHFLQVDGRSMPLENFKLDRELRGFVFSTLSSVKRSGSSNLLGLPDYYKAKNDKNPLIDEGDYKMKENSRNDYYNERDKNMAFALASSILLAGKSKVTSIQASPSLESYLGKSLSPKPSHVYYNYKRFTKLPTIRMVLRKRNLNSALNQMEKSEISILI